MIGDAEWKRFFRSLIPTWRTLNYLSTSRAIHSANIWALVVPVAAKLMEHVQDVVTIELFGHPFLVSLSLPFSWKVLFVAALAFLLANLIFALFCPPLIKETESYRDFLEQKRSGNELYVQLEHLKKKGNLTEEVFGRWFNWFSAREVIHMQPNSMDIFSRENEERAMTEAYANVVEALATTNSLVRLLIGVFYLIGFLAFAALLYQNIAFVFTHW